jgi:dimethylargininase
MLMALTRGVSSSIGNCQLTFLERECIDTAKAIQQHQAFIRCLEGMNVHVIPLREMDELPDAVFVEDTAIVVDEVAVVARMGARQRQPEVESMASALSEFFPLRFIEPPGTLEGGDVVRVGRTLYVGLSGRTNREGIAQLGCILAPFDYQVRPVEVRRCLHLSTGCSYLGRNIILANPAWIDVTQFEGFEIINVPAPEPWAANTISKGNQVLCASAFTQTHALLEELNFSLLKTDISELTKTEAGLSCMCLIFEHHGSPRGTSLIEAAPFW